MTTLSVHITKPFCTKVKTLATHCKVKHQLNSIVDVVDVEVKNMEGKTLPINWTPKQPNYPTKNSGPFLTIQHALMVI